MKLTPEQFYALVEYIDAKSASEQNTNDRWMSDRTVSAYRELEEQLKGDHP